MAKTTEAPAPQTGRVITREVTYADVPDGGRFTASNRQYIKRSGDRRQGGEAECQTDPKLSQVFFDLATVTVEEFVPSA